MRASSRRRPGRPPAESRPGAVSASAIAAAAPAEALSLLASSPAGLTADEAERRLRSGGPNVVAGRLRAGFLTRAVRNFVHVLALLLWVASLFAFAGGLPELGWAIIAVILVNGFFTLVQEYRAGHLLEALQSRLRGSARVRRDGVVTRIDSAGLVPGDVVLLQEGDRVPADCRLLSSAGLGVDQSALTGESLPVEKQEAPIASDDPLALTPVAYAGTLVAHGDAEAVVYATGAATQFGAVTELTYGLQDVDGPLERAVERLSITTAVVAVLTGLVVWAISSLFLERSVEEGLTFAIGVIVALVPEGLLPTLSLSLAIGAQRMARRNVLVRRLSAIEALGATEVICTDKTGTLTLNQLTVARLWTPRAEYEVSGGGYSLEGGLTLLAGDPDPEGVCALLQTMARTSNATIERTDGIEAKVSGDPTEAALLVAATKAGVEWPADRLREYPFDSFRRLMSTVDRTAEGLFLHTKGAPDAVLARCAHQDLQAAAAAADRYAAQGMRVLAAGRRRLDAPPPEVSASKVRAGVPDEDAGRAADSQAPSRDGSDLEQDLAFMGLVAMVDPMRAEVLPALERARRAGIKVVIITGDHPGTAAWVAREAGISRDEPHVVTGQDIDRMGPPALRAALERDVVFARTTPVQKLEIVSALQDMGRVVAVIGDGVNDAPSLRRADVGVAMGLGGTDVAREAADIVLTDDNFATVIDAIEEGRAIFANIRKFVTYVFTSNVAELAPFVAYVLTGIPLPLKVLQILAVDLGTDLVPALGLGAEPPEPGVLDRPPRPRSEALLNRDVIIRTFLVLGPIEAALGLAGFFFVYLTHGWRPCEAMAGSGPLYELATTMTFAAIVTGQIGAVLACRGESISPLDRSVLRNKIIVTGVVLEVALILLLGRVPPLQGTFGFQPLGWREFAFLAAILPIIPLVAEVLRRMRRSTERRVQSAESNAP